MKRIPSTRDIGAAAEAAAAHLLENSGLRIVARNYRTRLGEIDLVARERDTLVFVEVRKRSGTGYGGAAGSITRAKQKRIIAAARTYLRREPPLACRFDVILVTGEADVIEWVRDAFSD